MTKKGKRKVQGVPQSQALPRHQEEEENKKEIAVFGKKKKKTTNKQKQNNNNKKNKQKNNNSAKAQNVKQRYLCLYEIGFLPSEKFNPLILGIIKGVRKRIHHDPVHAG